MKTFKLVGLRLLRQSPDQIYHEEISLIDGLIINKEDEHSNWLIEIFVSKEYLDLFEQELANDHSLIVHATITKPSNDPATFKAKVRSITKLGDFLSILLDSQILMNKTNLAEVILADLIEKGLTGDDLLIEFKHQIELRKRGLTPDTLMR